MPCLSRINVYIKVKFRKNLYQKLPRNELNVYINVSSKIYFTKWTVLDPASNNNNNNNNRNNNNHENNWGMILSTDTKLKHDWQGISIVLEVTRERTFLDIAGSADYKTVSAEEESWKKQQRIHRAVKMRAIQIVISVLGAISKNAKI